MHAKARKVGTDNGHAQKLLPFAQGHPNEASERWYLQKAKAAVQVIGDQEQNIDFVI